MLEEEYSRKGVDIVKLKYEMDAVGEAIEFQERDARIFLRNKMGLFLYSLWTLFYIFSFSWCMLREEDLSVTKAKKLGWKDTFQYPKGFD